jgi:hypothetical protein
VLVRREFTVWCFDHADWVCDDCGCYQCREEDAYRIQAGVVER